MTTTQIVLLVVGILVLQILIWIPVLYFLKRKAERMAAELKRDLETSGDKILRGPEPGLYRGGSGDFSIVKGNGVAVLTERRLIFRKIMGAPIEIPVSDLVGVREDKWFLRATNGHAHVIVKLKSGAEVGFIFRQHAEWMAVVKAVLPPNQ
jgi:hypothetical protein